MKPYDPTTESFDAKAFRRALGRFPTGVTIITGCDPESQAAVGLTVSSFNSLSLSPPLVLWSIAAKSPSLTAFTAGRPHLIHVLHSGQSELARHFATPNPDKLNGVALKPHPDHARPPELAECAVVFDCLTERLIEAGDHFLVIAGVRSFHASDAESLIFCNSQFLALESLAKAAG
ncbi:MAG: flavin reductase family protein [Burkholderiaceae bacterium]